ncbi:Crotonobetainyl-CoA reductase [Paraburkholderia graminis C4D1M]|jgi:alkylation response protein AidB-like acyl-CoA dehydrogenase|uniref:Acyl-CoA dehydrogenase domain protein n=1 Tax=Paraburkholderia graminis (strain ATCC 700544 / DSM 17151 / LMG 18924 / NCIMB 13744 / C4D1M) TaxID=396598 RepID=B1G9A6_PARG4|nr:acyl-CoA dehydrogenase family protein [Paraburkholderia graminis]EDT07265.1 acyl-CoA dehydrogenase domain protein [Paraburkholderia graminis C4D1M]CAB3683298.1 Crotonobetainyl-CoA reductase [Paraburkholderia graminis C4D1M]
MNFQHTEDRRMLADTLNRFISEQYGFATRDRIARTAHGFSSELWNRFGELGIIGALFDEASGGFGGGGFDIAVVFESLGRGLVVEPFLDTLIVGQAIARSGNDAQRALLGGLIDGSRIVALAHGEPDSHYELARVTTRAERNGDGDGSAWQLNGAKAVVQHGEQAAFFLVSARTEGADDSQAGVTLFLVPRDAPGVSVRGYPKIDGGRAAEVSFENVILGDDALLGAAGNGFATLEYAIACGVLALCSEAVGAMDVAKDYTLDYLRTRKQFGVAIGSFQALQHRMADMLLEIEQARSAVINAAAALGAERKVRERVVSAAKYSIGRIGALVAQECIQLHGGIGMTWELPLAHYAKRLVMIDHQLGDEDHHLERFVELGRE